MEEMLKADIEHIKRMVMHCIDGMQRNANDVREINSATAIALEMWVDLLKFAIGINPENPEKKENK